MSVAIVSNLQNSDQQLNYVLIPFNDPDFYPPIDSFNGSDLIKHLGFLNSHGASGGMVCYFSHPSCCFLLWRMLNVTPGVCY